MLARTYQTHTSQCTPFQPFLNQNGNHQYR
nr:MAG TPA: hypothetical protein [Caudoviricetes sp.]